MKQRELENAKLTAEEMESQLAPLRYSIVSLDCLQCACVRAVSD